MNSHFWQAFRSIRLLVLFSVVLFGCATTSKQTKIAFEARDYAAVIKIGAEAKRGDSGYAEVNYQMAQSYFALGQFENAQKSCDECLEAWQYGGEKNSETVDQCMAFGPRIRAAIDNLPENIEKRRFVEVQQEQLRVVERDKQEREAKLVADKAERIAKMRPFYSKAVSILEKTVNLQEYFDRDSRLAADFRPEMTLKAAPGPSDEIDSVTVGVHIVPRANWREIRMDTLINGGMSPSRAKSSMNQKPLQDTLWATFRVNVVTRTVYSVDSWASAILQAQNAEEKRAKELKEYYKN